MARLRRFLCLRTMARVRENMSMGSNYAPQRRESLALHHQVSRENDALAVRPSITLSKDAKRQRALSVPESVRALGEPLEPFFDACGGRQTISLSVRRRDGRSPPVTYVFQQPFVLIGRCSDSDLPLDDENVGFRHFYLQLSAGRWLFVNLLGAAGYSREKSNSVSGWYDQGSELTAGPYTITRVASRPTTSASTAISRRVKVATSPAVPSFQLALLNAHNDLQDRRIPRISSSLTLVGGSRRCDVWLKDDSVSRVHASMVLAPRGLWIVDLLGRDGVIVDGHRVYWKQLHDGSVVQIGRFRLGVRFDQDPETSLIRLEPGPPIRKRRKKKRRRASGGSISERSVLALFKQMAEMQAQFFEHSQLQM